jgi:hypothetical protein
MSPNPAQEKITSITERFNLNNPIAAKMVIKAETTSK